MSKLATRWLERIGVGARRLTSRWPVLLVLGFVAVAAPASAVDRFEDVAAGSAHHDAITELADSGVTTGCRAGRFCPDDAVSREQMASFLTRAAPRSSFDRNVAPLDASTGYDGVPASVTVRATGASGGTGNVTLQGSVSVYTDGSVSACPCEIEAFIFPASDEEQQGPSSWTQLPDTPNGNGRTVASVPVSWTTDIPSGTTETFRIAVFFNGDAPGSATAEASLTAITTAID